MATKQFVSSFTRLVLPLCVLVLLLGVPSHRAEAQCQVSPCVDSADIVNDSVARVDLALNAVGAAQIAANSLTEQHLSISRRLVVAQAGGDFASISAALETISDNGDAGQRPAVARRPLDDLERGNSRVVDIDGQTRPNILVLMADEHFADAMSSVIGTQHLNTPNLDSLAASGMRFKRSYAANPICIPSRSAMLTGRFPHQIGIQSNQATNLDAVKYPLMGKYFSDAGYDTGYIGKWHIPFSVTNKAVHGFQTTANIGDGGIDAGMVTPTVNFINTPRTKPFLLVASFINPHNICEWARGDNLPDGAIGTPPAASSCPPLRANNLPQTNEPPIIALVRQSYQSSPQFPVGGYTDTKWRQYIWAYYRMIEKTDAYIGQILQALRDSGQESNTVVIFTSDHGDGMGSHKWNQKTLFYDESARVPLIISQKGTTIVGTSNRLVNVGVDLLPTAMEFAGIAKPAALPGLSLANTALGTMTTDPRTYIVTSNKANQGAAVNGTIPKPGGRMVRSSRYKYCAYDEGTGSRESLVDMQTDPGEMTNLAGNPSFATVLSQHRTYLSQFKTAFGDPFPVPTGGTAITFEADALTTTVSSGDTVTTPVISGATNGTISRANLNAVGDFVQYSATVPAGHYSVSIRLLKGQSFGIWQFSTLGANLGAPVDGYATSNSLNTVTLGTTVQYDDPGPVTFKFTVTGKTGADFDIGIEWIRLTPL